MTREYLIAALDLERAVQDAPDPKRAERFSAEYEKCLEAKQYDHACELAAEIIERKGTSVDASDWFEYGYCLMKTGRYKEAPAIWDRVVAHSPENSAGGNNRGNSSFYLGNYSVALANYDKALTLEPNYAYVWNNRGAALSRMVNYSAALESYNKSLEIEPDNTVTRFNRAEALLALGRWGEFLKDVEYGFAPSLDENKSLGDIEIYCRLLLQRQDFSDTIRLLVQLYKEHEAVKALGQGVTKSIPAVLEDSVPQSVAEKWLEAWQAARGEGEELEIPVRILAAAVGVEANTKHTRSDDAAD